ncbi:hypothetical protein ZHAS_00015750 [Anopheles sinensis]|uniref:Uncharacterized protein n=1 Tax=Anopheles sinensis TaxID=74873 RepID=A0A084WBV7_ANOSI|nr:hypothetical protein ZHAS_00015750 [Anopheles sinensis]
MELIVRCETTYHATGRSLKGSRKHEPIARAGREFICAYTPDGALSHAHGTVRGVPYDRWLTLRGEPDQHLIATPNATHYTKEANRTTDPVRHHGTDQAVSIERNVLVELRKDLIAAYAQAAGNGDFDWSAPPFPSFRFFFWFSFVWQPRTTHGSARQRGRVGTQQTLGSMCLCVRLENDLNGTEKNFQTSNRDQLTAQEAIQHRERD